MIDADNSQPATSSVPALELLLAQCQQGDPVGLESLLLQVGRISDGALATAAIGLMQADQADAADALLQGWLGKQRGFWSERALGLLMYRRQQVDAALAQFAGLCETYPDEVVGYTTTVEYLVNSGRFEQAQQWADRALPRFADNIWLLNHCARLAQYRHDLSTAFHLWQKLNRLDPAHVPAREGMARILIQVGQYDKMVDLLAGRPVALGPIPVGDADFRCPVELRHGPTKLRRCLLIGSCLSAGFPSVFASAEPKCETDFILVNNLANLPELPPCPVAEYDFQVVQIPLRVILNEGAYFHLRYDDKAGWEELFQSCCQQLSLVLASYMQWNTKHGILSFVSNFLVPQQNPMGRLLPRNDLRNMAYLVERINEALSVELATYKNAYLLDVDQIAASIGRRYIQEDMLWLVSHGSALSDFDHERDTARLEPLARASAYYPGKITEFIHLIWREIEAMYRSANQIDMVKMVLVDLDDTLWRGVLAETGSTSIEGWPLGFAEALVFLKQRGIILGIVSKNTEARIVELWPYKSLLPLDAFAVRKINWQPKAENIAAIMQEVNLLPGSVVYFDDNPVERDSIKQSFPGMRVLGSNPYFWRRILLWAPETQTAAITAESANRTEMIKAQSHREQQRKVMSREEFLHSLQVVVTLQAIRSSDDPAYARALELINKTNQFNTTGVRWTAADAQTWFDRGGVFYAMHVTDKFTAYGLVGVLCVRGEQLAQFVMSCRVVGLDVEIAAVALTLREMQRAGTSRAIASLIDTPANLLSRTIWQQCGFTLQDGNYALAFSGADGTMLALPSHISNG